MDRFYGEVGYCTNVETTPGVYEEQIQKRNYYGNIQHMSRRIQKGDGVNFNVSIDHKISIIADAYAMNNFCDIRYIEWRGTKWTVTNVEVQPPRLLLSLGEVYNGE